MAYGTIDGDDALYHYFKEAITTQNPDTELVKKLILNLSIWLPVELYQSLPVLRPFIVRDPTCRKSVNKKTEEWGSCDKNGYFRDDNSLVKAIPRTFRVVGPNSFYHNKKMAKGFVASHIWGKFNGGEHSARNPLANTFVPNLVWLPSQVSKLTDREGSVAQNYAKAISLKIYRGAVLSEQKKAFINKVWNLLSAPETEVDIRVTDKINFFKIEDQKIELMRKDVCDKVELLKAAEPKKKFYCSRYFNTYSTLSAETRAKFVKDMEDYVQIIK